MITTNDLPGGARARLAVVGSHPAHPAHRRGRGHHPASQGPTLTSSVQRAYDTVAESYATYLPDTRAESALDLADARRLRRGGGDGGRRAGPGRRVRRRSDEPVPVRAGVRRRRPGPVVGDGRGRAPPATRPGVHRGLAVGPALPRRPVRRRAALVLDHPHPGCGPGPDLRRGGPGAAPGRPPARRVPDRGPDARRVGGVPAVRPRDRAGALLLPRGPGGGARRGGRPPRRWPGWCVPRRARSRTGRLSCWPGRTEPADPLDHRAGDACADPSVTGWTRPVSGCRQHVDAQEDS